MTIKKISLLAIIAAATFGLASCHSSKKAVAATEWENASRSTESGKSLSAELTSMAETYYEWTDVQVPVKIQIQQPKRISLSGVAKMRKGENIHISIRVFGFEAGSLYIDKETVQVYIKMMDMYWSEPLTVFTERYGLTLGDLQSLLLGQPFLPGSGTITASDVKGFNIEAGNSTAEESVFNFTPKKLPSGVSWTYTATTQSETAPYLSAMTITPGDFPTLDCTFGQPSASPAGVVTSGLEAGTILKGKEFHASLNWSFESSKWNSGLKISKPSVSKSARKVETAQLLNMLKSL